LKEVQVDRRELNEELREDQPRETIGRGIKRLAGSEKRIGKGPEREAILIRSNTIDMLSDGSAADSRAGLWATNAGFSFGGGLIALKSFV
jgi:hypothetical protein